MISPIFAFLVPFAFVNLSYIECYCYCPENLKRDGIYDENNFNGVKNNLDRMPEIHQPKSIPSYKIPTGTPENKRNEEGINRLPIPIPSGGLPNGTLENNKRFDFFENHLHRTSNYRLLPIALEDTYLDTSKEEARTRRGNTLGEDNFKRKMAGELYLNLWKHLERIENHDK